MKLTRRDKLILTVMGALFGVLMAVIKKIVDELNVDLIYLVIAILFFGVIFYLIALELIKKDRIR